MTKRGNEEEELHKRETDLPYIDGHKLLRDQQKMLYIILFEEQMSLERIQRHQVVGFAKSFKRIWLISIAFFPPTSHVLLFSYGANQEHDSSESVFPVTIDGEALATATAMETLSILRQQNQNCLNLSRTLLSHQGW